MARIRSSAAATAARSVAAMATLAPLSSSSTMISAPVSSWRALMTLPLGPMTSPILSVGISKLRILGAVSPTSERGPSMAPRITSRICILASRAWSRAPARTEAGMPSILVSSCNAVT